MKLLKKYVRHNMYNFISLSDDERRIIFENTASKMGLNSSIIEKDFWVCLVIDYLFNKCI